MKLIKVAAGVLNQTPLAWNQNCSNIIQAIEKAKELGVSILCLPEMCISGYGCEDAFHSPGLAETAWKVLFDILPSTKGLVVSLGLPLAYQNALFNAACLLVNGEIKGFVAKRFLAGDGLHYEPRWFKPWAPGVRVEMTVDGKIFPLGDIFFNCGGVKIGFEICEDAWVANRPGGTLALRGIDLILNPSASHFAFGKPEVRRRFVIEGSRAFGVSYLYANLLGNESGRAIYDGDALIASGGKLLSASKRFSFSDFGLAVSSLDIHATRLSQARTASFQPILEGGSGDCVFSPFEFPELDPESEPSIFPDPWEKSEWLKEEEFTRAIALALFDYLRKSRSNGFVVSLSGGADSTACSCLVRVMVELGVKELGLEGFLAKLGHISKVKNAKNVSDVLKEILCCVYQATSNSSHTTEEAARIVATSLEAEYLKFDVESFVHQYTDMVSKSIGRPLRWETDDVALQNIQARVRGPGVWLLANIRGALLVSTSNRSEAAVGYATMDGDTCGGISPIAGINKAFIRRWLNWMEVHGPSGLHPFPYLSAVNSQQPTAELRPKESSQTDEDDLMPYEVLDLIERWAIRDKRSPIEVFKLLRTKFSQFTQEQLRVWVERFFALWCRNQWKRERYAPSFNVDDENLDPKTWCRFPILSGGFEWELGELKNWFFHRKK